MDIQRYLLIAASAALSFMLLSEWATFKDQRVVSTQEERFRLADTFEREVPAPQQSTVDAGDTPTVADPTIASDDVPTVLPSLSAQENAASSTANARNIVVITSDVLEIVVDFKAVTSLKPAF